MSERLTPEDVRQAYKIVFSTHEGQIVLNDLMVAHCMTSSTVSPTTEGMLIKEGGRNAVLRILALAEKQVSVS